MHLVPLFSCPLECYAVMWLKGWKQKCLFFLFLVYVALWGFAVFNHCSRCKYEVVSFEDTLPGINSSAEACQVDVPRLGKPPVLLHIYLHQEIMFSCVLVGLFVCLSLHKNAKK